MNFIGFALRNLRRRPLRTALSVIGIALAVGSTVTLVALSRSIEGSAHEGSEESGADLTVTQRGATDIFGSFLRQDLEQRVAEIPGVTGVTGELAIFAVSENDRHLLTFGWSATSFFWATLPLREGRLPAAGESRVAIVGDMAAEALAKHLGDEIEIVGEQFRIIGVAKYASVVNRGLVIVPIADLQEILFRRDQVTLFHVRLAPNLTAEQIAVVERRIEDVGPLAASMTSEILHNDRNFKLLNAITATISSIAMAMGILNILNTLVMTVQERTREIGIVAAIGWSSRRIMTSIVAEGIMLALPGCALGVVLGYFATFLFRAIPVIGAYLDIKLTAAMVLAVAAGAIALCGIGSLYPAWRATRMTPAEALQRA